MSEEGSGPLVDERPEPSVDEEADTGGRRPLPPLAYPLLAVLFGGSLVWSFSRVLLAVGKDQAVAIAILMALNILVASALIAYGSRVRRRPAALPFLALAVMAVIAIGLVANFAYGDRGPEKKEGEAKGQTVSVTAQGTKFLETDLTLTAGADVTLDFDNKDSGTQHNIAIFKGPDANAPVLFRGSFVTGPKVAHYTFKAPQPGKYFFRCDVHPQQMTGTITVNAGGGPGGAPPPSAPVLTAANTAFNPTTLKLTAEGGKVTIHFDNKDAGIQHNVAIFNGTDATAPVIFRAPFVTGPATKDFTFDAPPPGTYFFHCDVHPQQMTGTITIS
jgi:plastocyanin